MKIEMGNTRVELREETKAEKRKETLQGNGLCEFLKPGDTVREQVCISQCTHSHCH